MNAWFRACPSSAQNPLWLPKPKDFTAIHKTLNNAPSPTYLYTWSTCLPQDLCSCCSLSLPIPSSLVAWTVKNLPAMWKTWVWSLGREDPLEKGMATHSSILAWRIPWTEEPDGLQSMGLQRVGHNWATNTFTFSLPIDFFKLIFIGVELLYNVALVSTVQQNESAMHEHTSPHLYCIK